MENQKNMHQPSTVGQTMVRVGVIIGLMASVVMLARLITGRKKRAR